jgi:hypothetical protein
MAALWGLVCKRDLTSKNHDPDRLTISVRLNGFGAGPAEATQPTIIADVIFLHDRGKYQTLYFAFYFGSLMVFPSSPLEPPVGSNMVRSGPLSQVQCPML